MERDDGGHPLLDLELPFCGHCTFKSEIEIKMNMNGQHLLVLGLGVSGFEAARLAKSHGAHVTVCDEAQRPSIRDKGLTLEREGITVHMGGHLEISRCDLVVVSPGIDLQSPFAKSVIPQGVKVIGELEFASLYCKTPLIAITGTNGKTTTTELITAALLKAGKKAEAVGNIGKAFSTVGSNAASFDYLVVEVSSFQLETIETFRPHVALHLNLTPDHLDRYAGMAEYGAAKERIFENQTASDFAIVNSNLTLKPFRSSKITFSGVDSNAEYHFKNGVLFAGKDRLLALSDSQLLGLHNVENMLAVVAAADALGIDRKAVIQSLCEYQPKSHRCEKVGEFHGVLYINDSKGTNSDAVEKALVSLERPTVLIAGGKDKGLSYASLRPVVAQKVKHAVLIGETRDQIAREWADAVPMEKASTLHEAVEMACRAASSGDIVLLSPGCSSFDMFQSYEDRGNQFRQEVLAMHQPKQT
jgi:UDP-N-acetylmuramoylalanine--D-glutamate ligase